MSNSSLSSIFIPSPNYSARPAGQKVEVFIIHHSASVSSAAGICQVFVPASRGASSTYSIGYDGSCAQSVDEAYRPWTTGSMYADGNAVTCEVSNISTGGIWPVSDVSLNKLIELIADVFKRNGIAQATYTGDEVGNIQFHSMYMNTTCCGDYLRSKMQYITDKVNEKLRGGPIVADTINRTVSPLLWNTESTKTDAGQKKWLKIRVTSEMAVHQTKFYIDQPGLKLPKLNVGDVCIISSVGDVWRRDANAYNVLIPAKIFINGVLTDAYVRADKLAFRPKKEFEYKVIDSSDDYLSLAGVSNDCTAVIEENKKLKEELKKYQEGFKEVTVLVPNK